jgi:hypothetical protein
MATSKSKEIRLRRIAGAMGWDLTKSKRRYLTEEDRGRYMLMDDTGYAVTGRRYDADLDDIEAALMREQERLRKS